MAAAAACDDDHDAWPYVHQIPSPTPQARLRPLPEIPIRPSTESAAQAKQFAESGWVCIGPAGNAVNSHDLAIFEMLGEECPENVGRWFVHAVVCGFFDTKVGVPRDDNDEPVYVVFRGAGDGPGFYRTWEEVVPVVVGRHGALYQKCQGWVEGALRLVQALCIGGIISHLADDAWAAEDLRRWLSALQPSSLLPLHTSPGLLPFQAGSAPNHGGRVGDDYTRAWEPTRWTLFDVSKRVQAERSPQMHPLAPRPLRTHNSSPILLSPSISRYPPRTPSARRFLSRSPSPHPFTPSPPRRQTPPLSAVGGYIPDRWERLPTVPGSPPAGSPPPHCTSSSSPHVDGREGVYSLQRGGAPWLYYTEFSDALKAFRYAVRTGSITSAR